jgi:hypothetical protein
MRARFGEITLGVNTKVGFPYSLFARCDPILNFIEAEAGRHGEKTAAIAAGGPEMPHVAFLLRVRRGEKMATFVFDHE